MSLSFSVDAFCVLALVVGLAIWKNHAVWFSFGRGKTKLDLETKPPARPSEDEGATPPAH